MPAIHDSIDEMQDTTLPLPPDSLSALYTMAYEFYRKGRYEDAKDFFQLLALTDSFERKNWVGLGACNQMLKEYQAAVGCYAMAALQDPSDPYAHFHAADCYFHMGNHPQAKDALDSAIEAANVNQSHDALLSKLKHISTVWSNLQKGGTND